VRREKAFDAIVDADAFLAARAIILERHRRLSNDELLSRLKELVNRHGRLSGLLIDESDSMPSSAVYRHRFGSLGRAYELIEYTPERDLAFIEVNRRLRQLHSEIVERIIRSVTEHARSVVRDPQTDIVSVNGLFTLSIVLARCRHTAAGSFRWVVRIDEGLTPDVTIAVRMDPPNLAALDYYVLPSLDVRAGALRFKEDNGLFVDGYRCDSLDAFFRIAETVSVEAAA
jgi:hypothetical protein